MRKILLVVLLAWSSCAWCFGVGQVTDPSLTGYRNAIIQNKAVFQQIEGLLRQARPGQTFRQLLFIQCGEPTAFFQRQTNDITICFEFMRQMASDTRDAGPGAAEYQLLALWFVIVHEYGHAVINATGRQVTGREEDVADQIAAMLLKKTGQEGRILSALGSSTMKRRAGDYFNTLGKVSDEHTMNPARLANLICWMAGDNPQILNGAIQHRRLTIERARRCADEADQVQRAVANLLNQ